jgi:DNA-binding GntR family transcriptional regulator
MQQLKRVDPLYEQIFKQLEESILEGKIGPGERLIDTKVAADYGISRSPVREAFRKLERDGLLINKEGNITVFTPSLQDALELYQVRIGLESVAVFWATQHMTRAALDQLNIILRLTKHAVEEKKVETVVSLNTQFHDSIVSNCGNNRLLSMMSNIRSLIRLCRNTIIKQYNRDDSFLSEHYEIFTAMTNKNPELASKRMEQHIYKDMSHFKEFYLQQNEKQSKQRRI